MVFKLIIILIVISGLVYTQTNDNYSIDSVLIVGKKNDMETSRQNISLNEYYSTGVVGYDLMSSIRAIGTNIGLDYNTIPYIEGADYIEQLFFIDNIPVPFQSRLLGIQSGLNSLLFSQLSLVESHSLKGYNKPIKIQLKTASIDTNNINFRSNINILQIENALSVPFNKGAFTIGYNRSLIETIKPFLGNSVGKGDFEYKKFPFYQSFQLISNYCDGVIKIIPLLIYSQDSGNFGISSKGFNFNSHQVNYGLEILFDKDVIKTSTTLYSNSGRNKVNYMFPEMNSTNVEGTARFTFEEFGINSNIGFSLDNNAELNLSLLYKYKDAKSENNVLFSDNSKSEEAVYASQSFESVLYYQTLLTDDLLTSFHLGIGKLKNTTINPSMGFDIFYSNPGLFDARFQVNYNSFREPENPIYYSFQNALWDPNSASGLFFIDNANLPLEPLRILNTSLNFNKQVNYSSIESNLGIKLFFRDIKNLVYAVNYPDEISLYNTNFNFKQDYNGERFGLSIIIENTIKPVSFQNTTVVNFTKSINHNTKTGIEFNALNYSPVTITNSIQFHPGEYYFSMLFVYSSGRYLFEKKIITLPEDSNPVLYNDYNHQIMLDEYFRADISFVYKMTYTNYDISLGISLLNIFDHKNESRRSYRIDSSDNSLIERSEYFNFPRYFILGISMNYDMR